MNYHNITKDDMLNGDGIRVVLWVSGCEHKCRGCHNPETWNYQEGIHFNKSALVEIATELSKDYVSGITITGGDPFHPSNRFIVSEIIKWTKRMYPNKTVWVYTGYTFEHLLDMVDTKTYWAIRDCDVIVDGCYIEGLRDPKLKWRGSSNQRVIDVNKTFKKGNVELWCD